MLQFLLFSTVPENLISNDGLIRYLLPSKVKCAKPLFTIIYYR